ncbi:MAG: tetratricopeptide repeat protein [Deltaproteobacteria bacterium]|nr:MAG: tetratricopeptide repeat protein [Deltaproteobacteria bacterium]
MGAMQRALLLAIGALVAAQRGPAAARRAPVDPEAIREALRQPAGTRRYVSSRAYLHYLEGTLALEAGDFGRAESELTEALIHDPDSVEVRLALARAQWLRGRQAQARANARQVVEEAPDYVAGLRFWAEILRLDGDAAGAGKVLERVIRLAGPDPETVSLLTRIYLDAGQVRRAWRLHERLAREKEAPAEHWVDLARGLDRRGDLEGARRAVARALAADPNSGHAHEYRGRLCARVGDVDCAFEAYRRAVELEPERAGLLLDAARLLAGAGRTQAAFAAEELALAADPDSAALRAEAARLAMARDDVEVAARRLDAALRLDPHNDEARFYRAWLAEEAGDFDAAARDYAQVRGPRYRDEARVRLAVVWAQQGRSAEALAELERLAAERPQDGRVGLALAAAKAEVLEAKGDLPGAIEALQAALPKAGPARGMLLYRLATLLDEAGREGEALERMQEVLESDPRHAGALNYVGYRYAEQGIRLGEAERLVRRALAVEPDNGYIVDSLGWVLFRQGRLAEALETLERAARLLPEHPVVLGHLGEVLAAAGRRTRAARVLRRALDAVEAGKGEAPPELRSHLQSLLEGLGPRPARRARSP